MLALVPLLKPMLALVPHVGISPAGQLAVFHWDLSAFWMHVLWAGTLVCGYWKAGHHGLEAGLGLRWQKGYMH